MTTNQALLLAERSFSPEGPLKTFEIPIGGFTLIISETIIVQWLVILIWAVIFFVLGRNLKVRPEGRRQMIAEYLVEFVTGLVTDSMGPKYKKFVAYIGPLICFSFLSNLMGLLGLRNPTSDVSMVGAWGIITFFLVQGNKFRTGGVKGFFKGFLEPAPFMLPFNIIGEIANPASQTIRHFANILVGGVIGGLLYFALSGIVPFGLAAIGVPAALSLYFDIFSAAIQAYIFSMLTISYVISADLSPEEAA